MSDQLTPTTELNEAARALLDDQPDGGWGTEEYKARLLEVQAQAFNAGRVAGDRPRPRRGHKCVDCGDWLIDNEEARTSADARATEALARLDSFSDPNDKNNTMTDGWDSYGAKATTPEAIATARLMLSKTPFPVPTNDGGIALEWQDGAVEVVAEILPDGSTPERGSADARADAAEREAAHWKGNHDFQVGLKRKLHEAYTTLDRAIVAAINELEPYPITADALMTISMALDDARAILQPSAVKDETNG